MLDATTAGASGTSAAVTFISDMRLRKSSCYVKVAGTSSGSGNQVSIIYIGTSYTGYGTVAGTNTLSTSTTTATLYTFVLGSSTAGTVTTSTDINARLVAGGILALKNGTDATGTAKLMMEMNLDPGATWTGPPDA